MGQGHASKIDAWPHQIAADPRHGNTRDQVLGFGARMRGTSGTILVYSFLGIFVRIFI